MPRWDHTLTLKELWKDRTGDDDAQAVAVSSEVADRVAALAKRVERKQPILSEDLDDIADQFREVPDADEPSGAFNAVLAQLYDLGDDQRIWIA